MLRGFALATRSLLGLDLAAGPRLFLRKDGYARLSLRKKPRPRGVGPDAASFLFLSFPDGASSLAPLPKPTRLGRSSFGWYKTPAACGAAKFEPSQLPRNDK
jgi:hypothetical protein